MSYTAWNMNFMCWGSACQILAQVTFLSRTSSHLIQPSCWSAPPRLLPTPLSGQAGVCLCHVPSHSEDEEKKQTLLTPLPLCPPKPCISAESQLPPGAPGVSISCLYAPRCPLMKISSPWSPDKAFRLLNGSWNLMVFPYSAALQRLQSKPSHLQR